MAQVCACAPNWRVELTDLLTGAITHTVIPVSFEFESAFLEAGRGTITFNRRGNNPQVTSAFISASDCMPRTTGIFFQRLHGGGATPNNPVNMFGGYVETFDGNSDGTITLGFVEMQKYLDYRMIRSDLTFTAESQVSIARDLVMYARGENINGGSVDPSPSLGIPLIGGFGATAFNRDRTYLGQDRPVIGELLKQLIGVEDGPIYQMFHYRTAGIPGLTDNWYSEMGFFDTVAQDSPAKFITWDHLTDFKVNVDGNETANQIDAFGDPQDDGTPLIATANSPLPFEPRFDAAPSFDGVTNLITLGANAAGYQQDHMFAALGLQCHFTGLDYGSGGGIAPLSLDDLLPGYVMNVDIDSPNWRIVSGPDIPGAGTDRMTINRVSVSVGQEGPEQVTAQLMSDSFPGSPLSAQPTDCEDC